MLAHRKDSVVVRNEVGVRGQEKDMGPCGDRRCGISTRQRRWGRTQVSREVKRGQGILGALRTCVPPTWGREELTQRMG